MTGSMKGDSIMDKSERWLVAFFGMLLATLVVIGICNAVGVGHSWPFPVVISMLVADAAVGVKAVKRTP